MSPTSSADRALPDLPRPTIARLRDRLLLASCVAATMLTVACGPSELAIDPKSVVDAKVQPASKQPLFCPGDAFQVELVVTLSDGTTCSSADPSTGCQGKANALIAPEQVNIEASPGSFSDPARFVFLPPPNPLETAKDGVSLTGFLDLEGVRSKVARSTVAPVYDCQRERSYGAPPPPSPGANGGAGPEIAVSVTSLSTPWFPNAALVRVESGPEVQYFVSPSSDRPIRIVSKGQDGATGPAGEPGVAGANGAAATAACTNGGDGLAGTNGKPGGKGGDGGPGGRFRLFLDDAKADALKARVILEAPGGAAGPAGPGGQGGAGGKGGAPGPIGAACAPPPPSSDPSAPPPPDLSPKPGKDGAAGAPGEPGSPGKAGPAGPAPEVTLAPRDKLFAAELAALRAIESAPRAK